MCRRRGLKFNAGKNLVMVLGGEDGLECEVYVTGCDWSICRNLNILDAFWTNQVQMRQSAVVLGSCTSHFSCLFICIVVRQ